MKPARFAYEAPETVAEAVALLTEHGDDAKVLAGGQSLVPMLNFRLARPELLIDITRVTELEYVNTEGHTLRIGATTKQATGEAEEAVATGWPIIPEALRFLAHPQIRNAGTFGGSVSHADPAAELPAVLTALEATFHSRRDAGTRAIPASEFFVTHMTTALEPEELLTEIEVPALPDRSGTAFVEFARRSGDFALAGAAALLATDESGSCSHARLALLSAAPTPLRATAAEEALLGEDLAGVDLAEVARAATAGLEPTGDMHGSTEFRRNLLEQMALRALELARRRVPRP